MTFQEAAYDWALSTFGYEIVSNTEERALRFTEEALELSQAVGLTKEQVLQMVDYVFSRPKGDVVQEVGGVMNTLGIMCSVYMVDLQTAFETELNRCWHNRDKIRDKAMAKHLRGKGL